MVAIAIFAMVAVVPVSQTSAQKNEVALIARTVTAIGANVQPGQQVFVSIELESLGDEVAGSFTVTFDQTKLSISGISSPASNPDVTIGTGVPAGSALTVNGQQAANGRIGFLVDSNNAFTAGPGRQIVRLRFTAAANAAAGPTTISFGNVPTPKSFSNALGDPLTAAFQDGIVNIQAAAPPVTVSGRVTTPAGAGLRSAVVSLVDSNNVRRTATTSTFGFYSFEGVPSGLNYTIAVSSRRYRFTPVNMMITTDVTNLDFIGQE